MFFLSFMALSHILWPKLKNLNRISALRNHKQQAHQHQPLQRVSESVEERKCPRNEMQVKDVFLNILKCYIIIKNIKSYNILLVRYGNTIGNGIEYQYGIRKCRFSTIPCHYQLAQNRYSTVDMVIWQKISPLLKWHEVPLICVKRITKLATKRSAKILFLPFIGLALELV